MASRTSLSWHQDDRALVARLAQLHAHIVAESPLDLALLQPL